MAEPLKIILPVAGLGTRLRPYTLTQPKPLVSLAGKTILDFVLEKFSSLPPAWEIEYVFIVGAMGEQIQEYMGRVHPDKKASYFTQQEMRGQSDAVFCAAEKLSGPVLISFGDTITNPDFSGLAEAGGDGVIWVKEAADVSQQGVVQIGPQGWIARLHEKPKEYISSLMMVGVYYFKDGQAVKAAIEEQYARRQLLKNEYYLADAFNILPERGLKLSPAAVDLWLDAGSLATVLETNAYLLEHGRDNSAEAGGKFPGVTLIPPVYIDPSAQIRTSQIGPHAVVEAGCRLEDVVVRNAIIRKNSNFSSLTIENTIA